MASSRLMTGRLVPVAPCTGESCDVAGHEGLVAVVFDRVQAAALRLVVEHVVGALVEVAVVVGKDVFDAPGTRASGPLPDVFDLVAQLVGGRVVQDVDGVG